MNKELGLKFAKTLNSMEGKDYIQSIVAFSAAPTIEGKKPSTLMIFNSEGKNTMALWREHGSQICEFFEIEQFEMKSENDYIVVFLYRERMLECYIKQNVNQQFLQKMGYGLSDDLNKNLEILKQRFEKMCPHEMGIFLGIPVEDVEGFIHHKGRNCLLCKYWKVYGNIKRAELLFNAYDMARESMAEFVINIKTNRIAEYM